LRIIANSERFSGERKEGYNVVTSFFAQHQLQALHLENEVLQELTEHGSGLTESELRNVLGCFLFAGDDVFKPIKVLSGGEKSRVALAKTLVEKANFLLLDEPTNHLDIQSIDVLIQALQQYDGSFVLVSHDRYFVTEVANKIWWIEDEQICEYPGNYTEFTYWKEKQDAGKKAEITSPKKVVKRVKNPVKTEGQKHKQQQMRKLEQKIEQLEQQIIDITATIGQIERDLANPEITSDRQRLLDLSSQHQIQSDRKIELSDKMDSLMEELMKFEE
jgi:ATP-binding cassette subfamily F protein 3